MPGLVEHSMLIHLNDDIRDAILDVGGDLTDVTCPFDYPDVIRTLLSAGAVPDTPDIKEILKEGSGIEFTPEGDCLYISSNSNGLIKEQVLLPNGEAILSGASIQDALQTIADNLGLGGEFVGDFLSDEDASTLFDEVFK